jgi:hypothetical protein
VRVGKPEHPADVVEDEPGLAVVQEDLDGVRPEVEQYLNNLGCKWRAARVTEEGCRVIPAPLIQTRTSTA